MNRVRSARSIKRSWLPPRWLHGAFMAALLLSAGCAQTEIAGREVMRLGPYRDRQLAPTEVDDKKPKLKAGRDVLRKEERRAIARKLGPAFAKEVGLRGRGGEAVDGRARLLRCRVRAGFTRRYTVYEARCRAALMIKDVSVVEVEGLAVRRTRITAITRGEVDDLKEDPRHPGFDEDDSFEVLLEAARTAARLLVDPSFHPRPGRAEQMEESSAKKAAPAPDQERQRRMALKAIKSAQNPAARAAAAVDLARWGKTEDAAAVVPLLFDPSPLVRQAAAVAVGELGDPVAIVALAPLTSAAEVERVRAAAKRALKRLCVLMELSGSEARPTGSEATEARPDHAREAWPSKSSTPGVRVDGEMPADVKKDSIWAQKEVCSKR